uniref:DUF5641 domain-containing protein n=1 Tax=Loa loa TaxID=7209 RepID=A0A1I7V9C8_LOALO
MIRENVTLRAPWSGGMYELVALTKRAMRKAIRRKLLWEKEFMTLYVEIDKLITENRSPRIGEIVLLDEHETPRDFWKLAETKELRKGKDGVTRAAVIKTPHSKHLTKSTNMLYLLEVNTEFDIEREAKKKKKKAENAEEAIALRTSANF